MKDFKTDNPENGTKLVAQYFFQLKYGRTWAITPKHKLWRLFRRVRDLLRANDWHPYYKAYIVAQERWAKHVGMTFYPTHLLGDKAIERFKQYIEFKKRRVGVDKRAQAEEMRYNPIVLQSAFEQSAHMFCGLRERFQQPKDEILKRFAHEFHAAFIVAAAWYRFTEGNGDQFPVKARQAYQYIHKRPFIVQEVRALYARAMDQTAQRRARYQRISGLAQ